MKSILFPTDFSKTSKDAFQYMLSFADMVGAEATVMNTFQATNSPRRPMIGEGTYSQKVLRRLKTFVKGSRLTSIRNIRFRAKEGDTARSLIKASKGGSYDLIAMGRSKNYDRLTQLIGSRTATVCSRAYCPVLVIPPKVVFRGIRNILVAHNVHRSYDAFVLNYLEQLSLESTVQQHFISLANKKHDPTQSNKVPNLLGLANSITKAPYYQIKNRLKDYIRQHKIDLLALRVKPQSFFKRLFNLGYDQRMIMELDIPILVLNNRIVHHQKDAGDAAPSDPKFNFGLGRVNFVL